MCSIIWRKQYEKMKKYEQDLLNHLKGKTFLDEDVPLSKVRRSLGSIANVVGNPLTKTEITLTVNLFFINGGIQIAPAALPVASQTSIPIFIFGLTDFYGGYIKSLQIFPVAQPWVRAGAFGIVGYTVLIGLPVFLNAQFGDLVVTYADGAGNQAWAVIHCNNVAYGTFLNSFVSDLITLDTIRYIVPAANINQFVNPINFGTQTLFGKVSTDSIDPRMYIKPSDFQGQISDIPINLPIDKTLMTGFQMDVFCPNLSWVLFVKKVESLTHKRQ